MSAISDAIERLERAKFYGDLVLRFREGKMTIVDVRQTLKPEELDELGKEVQGKG
jgi:hypothetical protein